MRPGPLVASCQVRNTRSSRGRRTTCAPTSLLRLSRSSCRLCGHPQESGTDVRFIIMHKADAASENGVRPDAELIARVGRMIGALSRAGALEGGEGLGPSAKGVRVRFAGGAR